MDMLKLASMYVGRDLTLDNVGFSASGDCENINIDYWLVEDVSKPSIEKLLEFLPSLQIEENNAIIQAQISELERIVGVRPFREYMISIGQFGVVTDEYPNGKIKDIDAQITALRERLQ